MPKWLRGMAAVLGGLGLLYALSQVDWSGGPSFPHAPAAPVKIRIEGPETRVTLEKNGDAWRIVDPVDWPADEAAIGRMTAGLAALTPESEATRRPESFGQYDMDEGKGIRIQAWSAPGKDPYEVRLGKIGPSPDKVYARFGKDPAVYLANGLPRAAADLPVSRWRNRRILDEGEVSRVRVVRGKKSFVLEKSSAAWTADGKAADQEKVRSFLSAVRLLEADGFVDPSTAPLSKAFGFDNPSLVLEVSLISGPPVVLSVGDSKADPRPLKKGGVETVFLVPAYRFSGLDKAAKDFSPSK